MLLSIFLLNSCGKDEKPQVIFEFSPPLPLGYNMEIDTSNVDSFTVRETFDFPASLEGELSKQNTTKDKIISAKLVFMRIQVMDYAYADSNKYGNLRDIAVLELDIKKTGVGQQLVAKKMISDVYTKAVNLDLEDVELKEYLKQDNFRMVIRYMKRRPMPNEMPFIISCKFRITADPL